MLYLVWYAFSLVCTLVCLSTITWQFRVNVRTSNCRYVQMPPCLHVKSVLHWTYVKAKVSCRSFLSVHCVRAGGRHTAQARTEASTVLSLSPYRSLSHTHTADSKLWLTDDDAVWERVISQWQSFCKYNKLGGGTEEAISHVLWMQSHYQPTASTACHCPSLSSSSLLSSSSSSSSTSSLSLSCC